MRDWGGREVQVMSVDRDAQQWNCVKGGVVNFQKVSAIVRDMGEPCLQQTPIKVAITVRLPKLSWML